jgi:AraC-like DNA-binding protein
VLRSSVRKFDDPDGFAASVRAGQMEATLIERGRFAAKIIQVDFHGLWMQRFSRTLPQLSRVNVTPGRAGFIFRTRPGPRMSWNGLEIGVHDFVRLRDGDEGTELTSGFSFNGAVSMPLEDLSSLASTMAGYDLSPPRETSRITAQSNAMRVFQGLHSEAGRLAETEPEILRNPTAARGLEQALLTALVTSLSGGETHRDRVAQRQHELVMRRFRRLLEENPGQPLYIPEICSAIGVSERTLQSCCQEHFGVGPKRYLQLRRLHLARRALRRASRREMTVTEVATTYGFWHFGHFAAEYWSVFGESPIATLSRPPQ